MIKARRQDPDTERVELPHQPSRIQQVRRSMLLIRYAFQEPLGKQDRVGFYSPESKLTHLVLLVLRLPNRFFPFFCTEDLIALTPT